MWRCTVCQHVGLEGTPPDKCPVCDSTKEKFTDYKPPVGGAKTWQNLRDAFVGESQAHFRDLAFARQAVAEELPQIGKLFRAIAAAEEVHAYNSLRYLGLVRDTQANIETAFQRENLAETKMYPKFIADANEEDAPDVALSFSQARDVDGVHGKLYQKAAQHLMAEKETTYYVCQVCGYVSDCYLPDQCPICAAPKEKIKTVD